MKTYCMPSAATPWALSWLCVVWLARGAAGASLRRSFQTSASTKPAENGTAELDGAVVAILDGRSPQGEYARLPRAGLSAAEARGATAAAEQLGISGAGIDLASVAAAYAVRVERQADNRASGSVDEDKIKRAVGSLNVIMGQVYQQLDERVIACSAMREKSAQWRDQLDLDLVSASDELARIAGVRTGAVTGIQQGEQALAKLNAGWDSEVRALNKTRERIIRARELQRDDVAKLHQTVMLTKCSSAAAASFVTLGQGAKDMWVCRSNISGRLSLLPSDAGVPAQALDTPQGQRLLQSLLAATGKLGLFNSSSKEAVPHELQHLKCSFGRLGCASLHLTAMRLLAEATDTLADLDDQATAAELGQQKFRARTIKQQEGLRARKMQLEQELVEAVSTMSSSNELRRSLSEELRTHLHETRAHQAQCKTSVRMVFETMCGLRKIRAFLVGKSKLIGLDDVVDCDVTDWQPGECSASCDNACPGIKKNGKPCGGESTLTREVIQTPGSSGMACPALSKLSVCNQVKCPVDCKVSLWSNWTACSKECGGGISSKTRKILQLPQNGGVACGASTESKPCNTGACSFCALKPWSNWSKCSAVCSGGIQTRNREPVEDAADSVVAAVSRASSQVGVARDSQGRACPTCSLSSPSSLLEMSKLRCPAASSPHRYNERACMMQKCHGDERCVEDQDLLLAIDGSASLSRDGFEALRAFAAGLIEKYQAPASVGVLQFGNGELLADGTITQAVKVSDLSPDLSRASRAIKSLRLLGGFPNMAQALVRAETMFKRSRVGAKKNLLVITNSKPLYRHKTFEQAARLRKQGVRIFIVIASDSLQAGPLWEKADDVEMVKEVASRPIAANFFHIKALTGPKVALEAGQRVVVTVAFDYNSPGSVPMTTGLKGKVISVDGGGDAQIKFDGVRNLQWVLKKDSDKLQLQAVAGIVPFSSPLSYVASVLGRICRKAVRK